MSSKDQQDEMDESARRLRQKALDEKSVADVLRNRLKYLDKLRESAKSAKALAEFLNIYMQGGSILGHRSDYREVPLLIRARKSLAILFGRSTMTLDKVEASSLFTWAMDHSKKVGENADRIEAELSGRNDERGGHNE